MRDVGLDGADLTGSDLRGHNLAGASFVLAVLADADLTGANVTGTNFALTTANGLTKEQFYSTMNYREMKLQGISLRGNDVSNWNLRGQDLSGASFSNATLTNADLTDAVIANATFDNTTSRGLTKDQLYSTASYKHRDLHGIRLQANSLRNWDLSEQNLTNADLFLSKLANVNLSDSNLTGAMIVPSFNTNLSGANLKNATLQGKEMADAIVDKQTRYNQWTVFPDDFNPVQAGLLFEETPVGDFDAGGFLDDMDVDALMEKMRGIERSKSYSADQMFDLNFDNRIDRVDLDVWVKELKYTWYGDANLDGVFDSNDVVQVFQLSQFEDTVPGSSTWQSGDWNGDGEFSTDDLMLAFQDGGYEMGKLVSAHAVPEPSTCLLWGLGLLAVSIRCRR